MPSLWEIALSNALMVCLLALGVSLLGRVWKNAAALHLLWILVLVKLFIPPVYVAGLPKIGGVGALPPPAGQEHGIVEAVPSELGKKNDNTSTSLVEPPQASPGSHSNTNSKLATDNAASLAIPWQALLGCIWALGTLLIAGWYGYRIARFRKLLQGSEEPPTDVAEMVARLSTWMGLVEVPEIRMVPYKLTPLVWAVGSTPMLVLPTQLFAHLSRNAQETVLAHELAHVQRKDHWVRILELAATTLFWWHPVVWYASARLRELAETCCDRTVVDMAPQQARTYATALVDTLDFLSGRPLYSAPLATAICSTDSLARRITMLHQNTPQRLTTASIALVLAVAMGPLALAFTERAESNDLPRITGRVTNEEGKPLPDLLVRVAVPATDMRFVYPGSDHKTFETRTDKDGRYDIELPGVEDATTASLDAMTPGYRRLSDVLYTYRAGVVRDISPGKTAEASFVLLPGLIVKGIVVNEAGKPIPNTVVNANSNAYKTVEGVKKFISSAGVERSKNHDDGTFEVYNFSLQPQMNNGIAGEGVIYFNNQDYISNRIDDIYALDKVERENLRIVLPTGVKASGIVLDAEGKPVPKVMVEVLNAKDKNRDKVTLTDSHGKFSFRGLVEQPAIFRVHAMKLRQKIKLPVELDHDYGDLELRLKPIEIQEEPKSVEVLGMKLADFTPKLRERYDQDHEFGALILDPGSDFERFGIGELREGYSFWLVGNERVNSVHEFVQQVLEEAAKRKSDDDGIRVVYYFSNLKMHGTNTQHMKLTEDDVRELHKVLEKLSQE